MSFFIAQLSFPHVLIMSDLLNEAEELARESVAPEPPRQPARMTETEAQRAYCQSKWQTVMVSGPGRLAVSTAAAWQAEARFAPTKYAQKCCLQAAAKWQARVVKS